MGILIELSLGCLGFVLLAGGFCLAFFFVGFGIDEMRNRCWLVCYYVAFPRRFPLLQRRDGKASEELNAKVDRLRAELDEASSTKAGKVSTCGAILFRFVAVWAVSAFACLVFVRF